MYTIREYLNGKPTNVILQFIREIDFQKYLSSNNVSIDNNLLWQTNYLHTTYDGITYTHFITRNITDRISIFAELAIN